MRNAESNFIRNMRKRHSFTIGEFNLRAMGGVILESPKHTIALRDVEFVSSYGNGDDIIDHGRYLNVTFDLTVGFRRDLVVRYNILEIKELLSTLTDNYHIYRDTYNEGWHTEAVLTAIEPISQTSKMMWETKLTFNRVPFWYQDNQREIPLPKGEDVTIMNPSNIPSKPTLIFRRGENTNQDHSVTVNGTRLEFANTADCYEARFEGEEMRHILINEDRTITHIDAVLPPDLYPRGTSNTIRADGTGDGASYYIIPNWRRL